MQKFIKKFACMLLTLTVIFSTGCGEMQSQTPKLRISEATNEWEVSYDDGQTWTSLGVKATGEAGANGTKVKIGENGNWFLDGVDTGVKASCDCDKTTPTPTPTPDPTPTDFTPITRFAVTSDLHLRENGAYESQSRLEAVLDTAYAYAESQTDYAELDGIFFVGDQTQNGSEAEQTAFFNTVSQKLKGDTVARAVMGNHEYYATGHYTADSMAQAPLNFMEFSGYDDDDAHLVIDGYHYIFASMDKYRGNTGKENEFLSSSKLEWLKGELDEALADDETGEKPIFVFQHVHAKDTVVGSSGRSGDIALRELLNDYPNVVDFSGHTHYSVTDPRAVWQGEFTAFNTGSMSYLGLYIAGVSGYYNEINENGDLTSESTENGYRNGNMYYICEISTENVMRVYRYDAIRGEVYGEPYYLDSFGDPTGFDYTDARKENSVAPIFAAADKISFTEVTDKNIDFSFPQATCKDVVNNYRIELYNGATLLKTEYKLSRSYLGGGMPSALNISFSGLTENTEYTVKVFPVNGYAKAGEPLVGTVTTEQASVINYNTLANFTDESNGVISNVDGYGYGSGKEKTYRTDPSYVDGMAKVGIYLDRYHVDGGSTKLAAFKVTLPTGLDLTKDGIIIRVKISEKSSVLALDRFTLLSKDGQATWQTKTSADFTGVTVTYQQWLEVKISSEDLAALGYGSGDTTLYFGCWTTNEMQRTAGTAIWFQLDEISYYEQV